MNDIEKEMDKSFFDEAYGMIIYTEILVFICIYLIEILIAILIRFP